MKTLLAACLLALLPAAAIAQGTPPTEPAAPSATPANPRPSGTLPAQPQEDKLVYVKMTTSLGDIVLELNQEKAPITVKNFLAYADKGFYDGTIFHRVIPNFMIQGGGFTPDMNQKPTDAPIKNEWENGLKNTRGTIAMARVGNPKGPDPKAVDSATAQFFINVVDNPFLDKPQIDGGAYAVFGRVISGMDTVDKIRDVKTGIKGRFPNVPVDTVTITKVARISADEAKSTSQDK
ncbi:MAG: peptidyl-prolyl cis-trans isomerase [Phycisphaerales bacterium]|nr:peptidyl-prolyl cis-trans isomerase [Phycisphaerales bacterium]